ncbi:transcriptional regulator family: Fungal Specific TF [Penicillium antarcticum]|uniref:transcriptional regulator family: Fungal Specific TF n=1 Tax=Penicillium antarcticum TaxID=416450 RepID=UPI00238C2408|nr:transcriptional regulator family: Fungal Specific TF [Penicillium antarcticum]KAJ5317152.1 transcriptional regulator family: Fungal Specific TF [Penicillium antarcticum]
MPRGETFSRSRTGCLQCRKKHNKCEEQQPKCSFCAVRDLDCKYPSNLKWIQRTQPTLSRHRPRPRDICTAELESLARSPALFADTCFETTEEKLAWEYYVRLVSSNVPALDGPDNPYRQLSIPALSSPILLETIICIATEHMLNFGLTSIDLAAQRQQRMLRTLGQNLITIDAETNSNPTAITTANKIEREALLTAVVLQGIVVAQTADGVLEPHVKCASWLMQALGYFEEIPQNPIARMIVQRFGMVDLMLAISRQRRPYAPQTFILNQPDQNHWDTTEPSFYKMTGCPQPLMCFLVRISHLACDMSESLETEAETKSEATILVSAFQIESELRVWGTEYKYNGQIPGRNERTPLDILSECFYWTAHLLLARRVFQDQTCSPRVQHLVRICFGLMDHLSTGCGPDSSLPQPFYLAAREAVSPEDRAWVRRKHESMTAYYREQQRNSAMGLIERIWEVTDSLREKGGVVRSTSRSSRGCGFSIVDGYVQALDRESCFFIF